ncbi:alpha/beta fold hydrolase [Acrocarpospora catenulata]|uniref:alpha/beta fold hydrolase n=1 Tax=Acrocarpospora catenulata TaxID=2836182 RepID=UPI001BDB50EE|nr:alpha/beta hydrolase [Acrocarpospora catenulata]
MPTVTSKDGTSIAYDQVGEGPPIILVDAAGGYRGFGPMGGLASHLAKDLTVITYDRRGRGESTDTQPYAVEREVEDLAALVEAAGGTAFAHGFSSGGVLILHAARQGVPISKMVLLEPPLQRTPVESPLGAEITALVAAGRRGDAMVHFHRSIGVPEEITNDMRNAPFWPGLEALAHTLAYDATITSTLGSDDLTGLTVPALVVDSEGSDARLRTWAEEVGAALPNGIHRRLPGEWHGVSPDVLSAAMVEFLVTA